MVDIPPVLADPFQSDNAFAQFESEIATAAKTWENIISQKGFIALQFATVTLQGVPTSGGILTQSTRSKDKYQLTRLDGKGMPLSHHDYSKTDILALANDLPYSNDTHTIKVKVKREECILSIEGDTADKLVSEGLQITETAVKLAGLGAKNLAALLLALLRDNVKLKGKTSMNRLLRTDKPLTTVAVKKADLAAFKKHATSHGVLFSSVHHAGNDKKLCDVIIRAEDAPQVNQILETMGYAEPKKDDAAKNEMARAQPGDKSNGRGSGWLQQVTERTSAAALSRSATIAQQWRLARRGNNPVKQFEGKTGGLESLGAETLAAMVLKVAGENREFKEASPLSKLFADGQNIQFAEVPANAVPALQKQTAALDVPLHFQESGTPGKMLMVARKEDAPIINRICEKMGMKPPLPVAPEQSKQVPSQPAKATPKKVPAPVQQGKAQPRQSVRVKVDEAKQMGGGEKSAPAKAKATKAKAPKPKAPVR